MYEFVEKVSEHTQKNYGRRCKLSTFREIVNIDEWREWKAKPKFKPVMVLYVESEKMGEYHGSEVSDSADFEEQVYEIVNNIIFNNEIYKYGKWEHTRTDYKRRMPRFWT